MAIRACRIYSMRVGQNLHQKRDYGDLTGKNKDEQFILNEILNSKFKSKCLQLDKLNLLETLPFIKNCNIDVCNGGSYVDPF